MNRLPRDSTDVENVTFVRRGGAIHVTHQDINDSFYPLEGDLWLVNRTKMNVSFAPISVVFEFNYMYIVNDKDIVSWVVSTFKDPDEINVYLDNFTQLTIYRKYRSAIKKASFEKYI